MMERYRKDYEYLKSKKEKDDRVFYFAISQIVNVGMSECSEYDLDKIAKGIPEDSRFNKEFQLAFAKEAKEISQNVSLLSLMSFIKEEVPARTIKMSYDRLMTILRNVIEMMLYPEDGGDHISEREIMQAAGIDEEEWREIYGN